MMKFTNNAKTTLLVGINTTQTTLTVVDGTGDKFPVLAVDEFFLCTLVNTTGDMEIVKVTARTGDTFTVVRAQEGTTTKSFSAGSLVSHQVTAGTLERFEGGVAGVGDLEEKVVVYAPTKAAADTLAAGLSDGATVIVDRDETAGGVQTRRVVTSGVLGAPVNELDSGQVEFTQAGTGVVARTSQDKMREVVSVKDFGAVGDGVADDTASIQAALDYAESVDGCVVDKTGSQYKITGMITILCDCDLSSSTFLVPATSVPIAVRVGSATADVLTLTLNLPKLLNTDKTSLGWSGFETSVGYDFANLYASNIYVPGVRNFGIGLDVGGYGKSGLDAGNAYNSYQIGLIYDNFINLRMRPKGAGGFANQNTFIGGNFSGTGAEGPPTGITGSFGVQLIDVNNNTFLNSCIESTWNQYQIEFRNSSFNTFISQRLENTVAGRINFHSDDYGSTQSNVLINGYTFGAYEITTTGAGKSLYNKVLGNKYADAVSYAGAGLAINNVVGDGSGQPHTTGYSATANVEIRNQLPTATDWTYRTYANGYIGKRTTDSESNFRIKFDNELGRIYTGDGSGAPNAYFGAISSLNWLTVENASAFLPLQDNSTSLGAGGYRWSEVFSATATINTSDARTKQQIRVLSEAERCVAIKLKGLIRAFKFNDSVVKKGDGARIHFGVIAQEVKDAFDSEGLVAENYALLCYDEWDSQPEQRDSNGVITREYVPAGNLYGVRYEELLAFIVAAL